MDVIEVVPGLHLLRLGISNAYLWREADGITLGDAGPPGSGPSISAALQGLGHRREDARRVVLTHFHDDHAGSAAEVAAWAGASILAGSGDVAFIRGETPGPSPVFTGAEAQLHAVVAADLTPAPACRVDQEVSDADVLDLAGDAVVIAVPGHTPGSIALHLPAHGVLITGDTIAEPQGDIVGHRRSLRCAAPGRRPLRLTPAARSSTALQLPTDRCRTGIDGRNEGGPAAEVLRSGGQLVHLGLRQAAVGVQQQDCGRVGSSAVRAAPDLG